MTVLERLGLEVVAYTMLGSRGQSALLMALLDGRGTTVSLETLQQARAWKMPQFDDAGPRGLQVRICRLRASLDDIGLGGVIETRGSDGYAITSRARKAVMARLAEEVSAMPSTERRPGHGGYDGEAGVNP